MSTDSPSRTRAEDEPERVNPEMIADAGPMAFTDSGVVLKGEGACSLLRVDDDERDIETRSEFEKLKFGRAVKDMNVPLKNLSIERELDARLNEGAAVHQDTP
jgi:hypothetical protein